MSDAELGIPFDIHGGGVDLVFPHHENEIAQTEAATGKEMAHYWMHSGMLQTSGEKMSKSLGNFMLLHDLIEEYEANVIRLLMLQTHYRSPLDFSDDRLREAEKSLERIRESLDRANFTLMKSAELKRKGQLERSMFPRSTSTELQSAYRSAEGLFRKEMDDDFNTAGAVGYLFEFVRSMNTFLDAVITSEKPTLDEDEFTALQKATDTLVELFGVLGINLEARDGAAAAHADSALAAAEVLLEERTAAREAKDWARADQIRDELDVLGFDVKDTPQGPRLVGK